VNSLKATSASPSAKPTVKHVSVTEAVALLASGVVDTVDVRDPRDWASGHVPGARSVPLDVARANPRDFKTTPVLFVCQRGVRSLSAAEATAAVGVADVYTLEGGVLAWVNAGLPLEKAPLSAPETKAAEAENDGGTCALPDPGLDAVVGKNLRQLRNARGLSLDALASISGVGRTLLGQIELGRASPSVGLVWKLARAFDVPFSTLLATSEEVRTTVLRNTATRRLESQDGRFASRALFPLNSRPGAEFYQLHLAAHSREDALAHQPGTRENLVVASGTLELIVNGERFHLDTGDAIVFGADVPHSYINPQKDPCTIYLVMTYAHSESIPNQN
jgi:rhodanese-related sulfurtransferase/transcriptional regulator with XRE-family HTH domain